MTRGMWKGQVSSEPVELEKEKEENIRGSRRSPHLPSLHPPTPGSPPAHPMPASYMSRLRMGRKCLVSLMAKMMLGMRKKVQHPRLNQKAFCKEIAWGSPLSCMGGGSPQALGGVWRASQRPFLVVWGCQRCCQPWLP